MDELKNYLLDLLFPRRCLGCEILIDDLGQFHICRSCLSQVTFIGGFACAFCKSPVVTGKTCPFCKPQHCLDRLLVTTSYEEPLVEKILKTLKYRFVKSLADDLGSLMAKYLKKIQVSSLKLDPETTMVVPVPLHRQRFNWRGFNQSEIMGQAISDNVGLKFYPSVLTRTTARPPQAEIADRTSRIENIKNIFKCVEKSVANKTVLLIDDISTTGSTLDDCARALKERGAKEVIGFVFARGK